MVALAEAGDEIVVTQPSEMLGERLHGPTLEVQADASFLNKRLAAELFEATVGTPCAAASTTTRPSV